MRVLRSQLNRACRAAILVLTVCVIAGLMPIQTVSAASIEVEIPYVQTWKNDSDRTNVDNTFEYQLTSADDASPLPDEASGGAYDFKLKGNTSGNLKLHFGYYRPGYYNYTVTQVISSRKTGYTYDEDTYNVMIMVLNGSDGLTVGAVTIQDDDLAKYAALPYANFYYQARRGTPGTGTGGGVGAAVQTAAADTEDNPPDAEPETEELEDTQPPLVERAGEDYWALLNLILMILTVVISAADIGLYFRKDEYDEDDELGEDEETREERRRRRHLRLRTGTLVPSIGGLILFLLTEDIRLPMEIVDEWTIWMVVIFAACSVLALLSREKDDEEDGGAE